MLVSDLVEVLCAAHLGFYVDVPYPERGGIMLVGEPGTLKTTFLTVLSKSYFDALALSDINARGLVDLRGQISTGNIRTLVLPELAKVYERAEATSANVEGTIRALVGEGFQAASFEDQQVNRVSAKAMVIAALTTRLQSMRNRDWEDSGFNRRFLWCLIHLDDPQILEKAVLDLKMLKFQVSHVPRAPVDGKIPNLSEREERVLFRLWCKHQPGGSHALQLQLLTRIVSVLRWWYGEVGSGQDAMGTLSRFAESLGPGGAGIEFPPEHPLSPQKRSAEQRKLKKAHLTAAARQMALSRKRRKVPKGKV